MAFIEWLWRFDFIFNSYIVLNLVAIIMSGFLATGPMLHQAWEMVRDEDGIRICNRSVAGSEFREFRAEMIVEPSIVEQVLNVIRDIESCDELMPDCYGPEMLQETVDHYAGRQSSQNTSKSSDELRNK
ncbi:MAG: hypothetical protein JXA61_01815 [Bacteroidales bacterium]|nr:hypothetical protein [Bacteroidales bacterium]